MMNATTTPTFGGKTADEWREEARDCRRRSAESWERSDTDGFLSQHALDTMAHRYERLAEIAELGGVLTITAYADLATGEIIKGEWRQTTYGSGWAPADRSRQWLFPSEAKSQEVRDRNNAKKGFREILVQAPHVLDERTMFAEPDLDAEWVEVESE